jgi:hypothetical protein
LLGPIVFDDLFLFLFLVDNCGYYLCGYFHTLQKRVNC